MMPTTVPWFSCTNEKSKETLIDTHTGWSDLGNSIETVFSDNQSHLGLYTRNMHTFLERKEAEAG